jgi:RHS repeat-associated protein
MTRTANLLDPKLSTESRSRERRTALGFLRGSFGVIGLMFVLSGSANAGFPWIPTGEMKACVVIQQWPAQCFESVALAERAVENWRCGDKLRKHASFLSGGIVVTSFEGDSEMAEVVSDPYLLTMFPGGPNNTCGSSAPFWSQYDGAGGNSTGLCQDLDSAIDAGQGFIDSKCDGAWHGSPVNSANSQGWYLWESLVLETETIDTGSGQLEVITKFQSAQTGPMLPFWTSSYLPDGSGNCGLPAESYGHLHRAPTFDCPVCTSIGLSPPTPGSTGEAGPSQFTCSSTAPGTMMYSVPQQTEGECTEGNPCVPVTGEKLLHETDFVLAGVSFDRHYSSVGQALTEHSPGSNWWPGWIAQAHVGPNPNAVGDFHYVSRRGRIDQFERVGAHWLAKGARDAVFSFNNTDATWTVVRGSQFETFASDQKLIRFGDFDQREQWVELQYRSDGLLESATVGGRYPAYFEYDEHRRLSRICAASNCAAGTLLAGYTYDALGRLTTVTRSDASQRTYLHENASFSRLLTGVVDEAGERTATYSYDASGRVTRSESAVPEAGISISYDGNESTVTTPLGATREYSREAGTFNRVASIESPLGTVSNSYDVKERIESSTSTSGVLTTYARDAWSRVVSQTTSLAGTPLRSRSYEFDPTSHRQSAVSERDAAGALVARSRHTYNARGQEVSRIEGDAALGGTRTTTRTYCEAADVAASGSTCPILGLLRTVDGPRTDVNDVASYDYYPQDDTSGCETGGACHKKGDLWKLTNALGHVTEYSRYDRRGRAVLVKDANGISTAFAYDARGSLLTRTVEGALPEDDAVTSFAYDEVGQVSRITQPDGDYLDYEYDDAHRLEAIEDAAGNRIEYALDAAGNRTAEVARDPGGIVRRSLARDYDGLGRLQQSVDALSHATQHVYDGNGNLTSVTDANGIVTRQEFDALDRFERSIQDFGGLGVETEYEYDTLDRLVRVTDPKGLDTTYDHDVFGNLLQLSSPDTGTTTYTYDSAGNRLTQTDARGVTATYAYDALNRLTSISYPTASLNVSFHYDQPNTVTGCSDSAALGRLTRIADASGSTTYCYDARGNVSRKTQVVSGQSKVVEYGYSRGGRLTSMVYPSGASVEFGYDAAGRPQTMDRAKPSNHSIVASIDYLPFGPATEIAFGAGTPLTFDFDQNYGIDTVGSPAFALDYELDPAGNLVGIDEANGPARVYGYDPLARLTRVEDGNSALIEAYTYDGTGNRQSKQTPAGTQTYAYPATNHRLTSIDITARSYDAIGSLTDRGDGWTYTYDDRQRLVSARLNGALKYTASYNGKGERVLKSNGLGGPLKVSTMFVYDEAGQLLGEYDKSGNVMREYAWIGSRPVAIVRRGGAASEVLYLHTDHLGTPRAVVNPDLGNAVVWNWNIAGSAFGEHAPNQDPQGLGSNFVLNLRYPGQYFDAETGQHYNYQRDYEPPIGRYLQSDPMGLEGGISTYAYAHSSPSRFSDPLGLTAEDVARAWEQVQRAFPDLKPRGSVRCDPTLSSYGWTANVSGEISVNQKYCDMECPTREQWEELFITLLHEGMHSTDPWYQGFFSDEHHNSIYRREQFESNRGNRLRAPRPIDMWGMPGLQGADFGALYGEFKRGGSECCEGK